MADELKHASSIIVDGALSKAEFNDVDSHVINAAGGETAFYIGNLGATAYVVTSDAETWQINFATMLRDMAYPVWFMDATADEVQINAAIASLPVNGGTVEVIGRNCYIGSPILASGAANVVICLRGQMHGYNGSYGSRIYLANGSDCNMVENIDATQRYLRLEKLVLDGNKANQANGHGVLLIPTLKMGSWLVGGLYHVGIRNCKQSGIYGNPGAQTLSLSAQYLTIEGCDEYGIYVNGVEGPHLKMPIWLSGNGKSGLEGAFTNGEVEVGSEGSGEYGVYIIAAGDCNIKLHTLGNKWQGVKLVGITGGRTDILAKGNCLDFTGVPDAADYRAQVYIYSGTDSKIAIVADRLNTPANTDGVAFKGGARLNLDLTVDSNRYGLKLPNQGDKTDCVIRGMVNGDTADVDHLPQYWYYFAEQGNTLDLQSFLAPGSTRVYSKRILYNDASPVAVCDVADGYCITDVWVEIVTTFDDGGARLDIGDGVDPDGFVDQLKINQAVAGYYGIEADDRGDYLWDIGNTHTRQKVYTGADTVDCTITKTNGTQGVAIVYVKITNIGG